MGELRTDGWRVYFLELCDLDIEVTNRTSLLYNLLESSHEKSGPRTSTSSQLAALQAVPVLPPSARLLLLPSVGAFIDDESIDVRLATRAALFACVDEMRMPLLVRKAVDQLVDSPSDRARTNLLEPLLDWCARRNPPSNLAALPLIAQPLAALSLLPAACSTRGQPSANKLLRADHFATWQQRGHLLLRAAVVRWLTESRWLGPGARDWLGRSWARDVDPFVAVRALRGWARSCPPLQRAEAMEILKHERRTLSWWGEKGLPRPSVGLSVHQQVEMVSTGIVLAMADLAQEDTTLAEELLRELERNPVHWEFRRGRPDKAKGSKDSEQAEQARAPKFDLLAGLERKSSSRRQNEFILQILSRISVAEPWLLARRVGDSEYDLGLESNCFVENAKYPASWFQRLKGRWVIRGQVRQDTYPVDLAERFPLAPFDFQRKNDREWVWDETADRGRWTSTGFIAIELLMRGRLTEGQRERLIRLVVQTGCATHQSTLPKAIPGDDHPLRLVRNRFTMLMLNNDWVSAEDFKPRDALALTRLCASALRSPPSSATYRRWVVGTQDRLRSLVASEASGREATALARYVVAVHTRNFELSDDQRPRLPEVRALGEMVPFLSDEDLVAATREEKVHIGLWAHVELVARALRWPEREIPRESLAILLALSRASVRVETEVQMMQRSVWRDAFDRFSLRLMIAWALSETTRSEFLTLLETILSRASTAALETLLTTWAPDRGRWWDDVWLIGRLTWSVMKTFDTVPRLDDTRAIEDRFERWGLLRRVLQAQPDAGEVVPLWIRARRHGRKPTRGRAQPASLTVREHGERSWLVDDLPEGEHAFVRRTEGATELPCVRRTQDISAAAEDHFGIEDLLMGLLTDAEHPKGHIHRLCVLHVDNQRAVFEVVDELGRDLPRFELESGELVDRTEAPMDLSRLRRGTVLHLTALPNVNHHAVRCDLADERIPRLAQMFRAGARLDIIKREGRLLFVVDEERIAALQLPIPEPDAELRESLDILDEGFRRSVQLTGSWVPPLPGHASTPGEPPRVPVKKPRGEIEFRGARSPEAVTRLLNLREGDILEGDELLGSEARGWNLDGLPVRLTPGAEHLGPIDDFQLGPPVLVVSVESHNEWGRVAKGLSVDGVVTARLDGKVTVRHVVDGKLVDFMLETQLELELGDLVSVTDDGRILRRRLDIEVSPIVRSLRFDFAWKVGHSRVMRFLALDEKLDNDAGGYDWITCLDSSTIAILPPHVTGGQEPPAPLVDIEVLRTARGWSVTPLRKTGLAAAVGTQVSICELGQGKFATVTTPRLVFQLRPAPPRECLLTAIEFELDYIGPHVVPRMLPPHFDLPNRSVSKPSIFDVLQSEPLTLLARIFRRGNENGAWQARTVDMRSPPLDIDDIEVSWGSYERTSWQRLALFWREGRICVSLRRLPPYTLEEWVENNGIRDTGSMPLYYAGLVEPFYRSLWKLPDEIDHHLFEGSPGRHFVIPSSALRSSGLARGDRVLYYRILRQRAELKLQPLAIEVEFANRVEKFHRDEGLFVGIFEGGKLRRITGPGLSESGTDSAPYVLRVEGRASQSEGETSVRFERREGETLVFRVVPADQVMRTGNLLLVEVVGKSGVAQHTKLRVRTVDGVEGQIWANDFSEDRMVLGVAPPHEGTTLLCRVTSEANTSRPARLSCVHVPPRSVQSLMCFDSPLWVIVRKDSERRAPVEVEVEPGWWLNLDRTMLHHRNVNDTFHRGDRLQLSPTLKGYRISIVSWDSGPWRRLQEGMPVMVQPWGTPESRLRQWRYDGTLNGHVIGATNIAVVIRNVPDASVAGGGPLPAVLREVRSSNAQVKADFCTTVERWHARTILYDKGGPVLRGSHNDLPLSWGQFSYREGDSHKDFVRELKRWSWRTEPGGEELSVLGTKIFAARDSLDSPTRYGVDHVLEQFERPDGGFDPVREFAIAGIAKDGLKVEITPGRQAEVPWARLRIGRSRGAGNQASLAPDGFGIGDVIGLERVSVGGLRIVSHTMGRLRRIQGAIVRQVGNPERCLGPKALRIHASFAGDVDPAWERVRLTDEGPEPVDEPASGDVVFLVRRSGSVVIHGFEDTPWRWVGNPADSACGPAGPSLEFVSAVGVVACTVREYANERAVLTRDEQIAPLLRPQAGVVRWARYRGVRDSTAMIVEISGVPWLLKREQWCLGPVNLTGGVISKVLEARASFEVTPDADEQWSAVAMHEQPSTEIDATVLGYSGGLLVDSQGLLGFVTPERIGYASLPGHLIERLFPPGTELQLALDEDQRLALYATSAIRKDLDWLRSAGGPIRVEPLSAIDEGEVPSDLGQLPSGLIVSLIEPIKGPVAAWIHRFQPSRRQLVLRRTVPERRWDIITSALETRLASLDPSTTSGQLPHLSAALRKAQAGQLSAAHDSLRRLWAQLRAQAHRTIFLPHPRHADIEQVKVALATAKHLSELPADPKQRLIVLQDLLEPDVDDASASAEATRCWLHRLSVSSSHLRGSSTYEDSLNRLLASIQRDTWDGLPVTARVYVTAAALSFSRGASADGIHALLSWDGTSVGTDPWISAAKFWRSWLTELEPSLELTDATAAGFLARAERLANAASISAAEVAELAKIWEAARAPWLLDAVDLLTHDA